MQEHRTFRRHTMENNRILIRKPLTEISHAEEFFRRLSGIDVNHIPEKYGDAVTRAREIGDNGATL